MVLNATSQGINTEYVGDNGILYGGTNYNIYYPKVTINAPYITLRKTLSISNTPMYLVNGGITNIPVPDTIITYTNFYTNTGNANATNLIIIDQIPYHTDLISTPTATPHTLGFITPQYLDSSNAVLGTISADVRKIRFIVSGAAISTSGGGSSGYIIYKVRVHRRE